ncbi:MAG TPA: hypothetical protein VFL30_10190 [Rhodanobacteraceae bacterium]|nr:hypothetical protein [Rhodanobacteraceae bacterium]
MTDRHDPGLISRFVEIEHAEVSLHDHSALAALTESSSKESGGDVIDNIERK